MRIYLAHPVADYGGSRQKQAIAAIETRGWSVENPDQPHHQEAYRERGMAHFLDVVADCDGVAFMRFPDGAIGAGVAKEIEAGLRNRIMIWDVSGGDLRQIGEMMPGPILSVDETRARLRSLEPSA